MIQVVRLFGILPNMLELTVNPCIQGCEYCYAKNWKKENLTVDKVINQILRLEQKKEGLLPFLIRKRSSLSISNRSDLLCSPNWREYLIAIKKMGFSVYLETKLNKEYKELVNILDPKTDYIYQTITGFTNKYEKRNLLSAKEKIEAAQYLIDKGFLYCLAVNPYLPDKISLNKIKELLQIIKPPHFVFRPYHKSSRGIDSKYFFKEWPKEINKKAMFEMIQYCDENKIMNDIDYRELCKNQPVDLSVRTDTNNKLYGGNSFVFQDILNPFYDLFNKNKDADLAELHLEDIYGFFKKQIKYFKDCIFTNRCYTTRYFTPDKKQFGIKDFLKMLWNNKKFTCILDYSKDEVDKDGNLIYVRFKNDLN